MNNNLEQEDLQDIKKQLSQIKDTSYSSRIQQALTDLEKNSFKYLSIDKLISNGLIIKISEIFREFE